MKKELIQKTILELASKEFKVPIEKMPLESSLIMDLGIDSLSLVELIIAIEEHFSINVPEEVTSKFDTLEDIINYVSTFITSSK